MNNDLVAINVKKVNRRVLKNGHIKKEWGVELVVNGCVVPVCFGSKAATMIYIGALLKQMSGERLYRKDFMKPQALGLETTHWLEELYNTLFVGTGRSFGEWYEQMKHRYGAGMTLDGHCISQGKALCNRVVKEALAGAGSSDGIFHINALRDASGKTYYEVNIPTDHITIANELGNLLYNGNMYTRA